MYIVFLYIFVNLVNVILFILIECCFFLMNLINLYIIKGVNIKGKILI